MNSFEKMQEELLADLKAGRAVAVVTVIATDLSTPQIPGAKMLVYPDGSQKGTVGGGPVEAFVRQEAQAALKEGKSRKAEHRLVMSDTGMYCGGKMEFFIEVHPAKATLYIFGGGHVGRAVSKLASFAGMPYVVVDDRPDYTAASDFPGATRVVCEPFDFAFRQLHITPLDYVIIVTRCHAHDEICLEESLKTSARYIGVIGSKTKIKTLFGNLKKRGHHPESDPRVYAPIGLSLGDSTVEQIGLSIISEVVMLESNRTGKHMRDQLKEGETKAS